MRYVHFNFELYIVHCTMHMSWETRFRWKRMKTIRWASPWSRSTWESSSQNQGMLASQRHTGLKGAFFTIFGMLCCFVSKFTLTFVFFHLQNEIQSILTQSEKLLLAEIWSCLLPDGMWYSQIISYQHDTRWVVKISEALNPLNWIILSFFCAFKIQVFSEIENFLHEIDLAAPISPLPGLGADRV